MGKDKGTSKGKGKRTPVTHALIVVDRSGSMGGLVEEVRGGFNSFVDDLVEQEAAGGVEFRVTAVLFDDRYEALATAARLAEVPRLTRANYWARGMTALHDAVGRTITDFEAVTVLGAGDQVILVVQTDGAENSSQEYKSGQIAEMLRAREALGWRTVYLGAGPAAWGQGQSLGFGMNVNTAGDADSTTRSYGVAAAATVGVARGASYAETVSTFSTLDVDADVTGDTDTGTGPVSRSASAGAAGAAV